MNTKLLRQFLHNVRIRFQGWEATLDRLYDNGWEVHMDRHDHLYRCQIILRNAHLRLAAMVDDVDLMAHRLSHDLVVRYVAPSDGIRLQLERRPCYTRFVGGLNPNPYSTHMERGRVFCLMDVLQPASDQQLLVGKEDEKSVDDFLNSILAKQTNLRQEIAERRVKENLIERPTAQLIKLFAA